MRLAVAGGGADWLALEKPAGVAVRQHPWDAGLPNLDAALNRQLEAGKPELAGLGATLFGSAYYLEPEVSGVAVFGTNRAGVARLRNRFGSGELRFEFLLVARAAPEGGDARESEAPLLPHRSKPKMIPSTAKGKKCRTEFRRIADSGSGWGLWSARTDFFRPHQVRAHAPLAGLSVMGDPLYGGAPAPSLGELKPKRSGPGLRRPAFPGLALHLHRLGMPEAADDCRPALPQPFAALLKLLALDGALCDSNSGCD